MTALRIPLILLLSLAAVGSCQKKSESTQTPEAAGAGHERAAPPERLETLLAELERHRAALASEDEPTMAPAEGGEKDDAQARCGRTCELADAICDLSERICALADEHSDESRYTEACSGATRDCDAAKESCDACG